MEKIVLITGANSGVGKSLAVQSALKGYTVVTVCRNQLKGLEAKEEIISSSKNESVHLIIADLSSLDSVKNAAEEFKSKFNRLHVLVNNAGINLLIVNSLLMVMKKFSQLTTLLIFILHLCFSTHLNLLLPRELLTLLQTLILQLTSMTL
jgi:NAD(P)-dependent dehydrogenase (short-subunit alcohol dehydrogenase family)